MILFLLLLSCDAFVSTQTEWMRACAETCKPAGVQSFSVVELRGYFEPVCACNPPVKATE